MAAAFSGDEETVRVLLKAGVDPGSRSPKTSAQCSIPALQAAIDSARTTIITLLLDAGADVNSKDGCGRTPLDYAVYAQNVPLVRLLLAKGGVASARLGTTDWSSTLLHSAAGVGNDEIARILLDAGANPNARDWRDYTPLHIAVTQGHTAITNLLVLRGARVMALDGYGLPPHVLWNGCRADNAQGTSPKCDASIRILLDAGADPRFKVKAQNNHTALHSAASWELTAIARMLLDAGADPNARNLVDAAWQGGGAMTPLHEAGCHGSAELVATLIERGADVNARSGKGWTPLDVALASPSKKRDEWIAKLREAGAREGTGASGACTVQ